jgi:peptidyl-prolyl cis-trans isomerase NIMA-interacting 1
VRALDRRMVRALVVAGALSSVLTGCVVTTHEGPGEPPRVAAPPPAPPHKGGSADPESFGETFAEAPARAEDRIGARHLLVMFAGSKRAPAGITRSRDEAQKRAEQALARALAGEDFAALVREYSDEPGAGERGGDLGRFERRMMVKAFADAAFALEIGGISQVVETEFGFHVIQRTE